MSVKMTDWEILVKMQKGSNKMYKGYLKMKPKGLIELINSRKV